MLAELNTSLLVGYAPIDAEHQTLAALIDAFLEMVDGGGDRHRVYDAVDGLSVQFGRHFEHEKAMMAMHRYPDTENHLAEHTRLMGDLGGFLLRVDETSDDDLRTVARFLEDWFSLHVSTSDRALGKFLKDRQAKAGG